MHFFAMLCCMQYILEYLNFRVADATYALTVFCFLFLPALPTAKQAQAAKNYKGLWAMVD